ncbi:hypothetical protein [Roseateles sp.]|nr:hypothetical protein [Roseateles sp.]
MDPRVQYLHLGKLAMNIREQCGELHVGKSLIRALRLSPIQCLPQTLFG